MDGQERDTLKYGHTSSPIHITTSQRPRNMSPNNDETQRIELSLGVDKMLVSFVSVTLNLIDGMYSGHGKR